MRPDVSDCRSFLSLRGDVSTGLPPSTGKVSGVGCLGTSPAGRSSDTRTLRALLVVAAPSGSDGIAGAGGSAEHGRDGTRVVACIIGDVIEESCIPQLGTDVPTVRATKTSEAGMQPDVSGCRSFLSLREDVSADLPPSTRKVSGAGCLRISPAGHASDTRALRALTVVAVPYGSEAVAGVGGSAENGRDGTLVVACIIGNAAEGCCIPQLDVDVPTVRAIRVVPTGSGKATSLGDAAHIPSAPDTSPRVLPGSACQATSG